VNIRFALLPFASLALLAQTAPDPGKPVLTIGDEKINAAQFTAIVDALPPQFQAQARSNKRAFADQLIQIKLLAAEAEKTEARSAG